MSMSKDELVAALKEASRAGYFGGMGGGGSGSASSGSTGGSSTDWTKKFTGAADTAKDMGSAFLGAASKVAEGGARMSDATDALSKGFAGLGTGGNVFGAALATGTKGLAALGQNIDQNIDTWRRLSDTGLAFGNDIMAMKTQASDARLSIAEMSEVLQKNNATMTGFGVTSAASAKALSKMSNEFFTSGLGEELRGMGYTTKELNDVLAVSISGQKIKDLNDAGSRDKALKAASSLAFEMDAIAKITGKSKEAQLDELRRTQADGQIIAATNLMVKNGGKETAEAMAAVTVNAGAAGDDLKKLTLAYVTGAVLSTEQMQTFALLSKEARQSLDTVKEATRRGGENDKERAAEATKLFVAQSALDMKSSDRQAMIATGQFEAQTRITSQTYKYADALELAAKELGPNATAAEKTALGLKLLAEQVDKEQKAGGKDDKRDDKDKAGASITRFAIDVESRGRDMTKAINDQVIVPLTEKVGPKLREFGKDSGITQQKGDPANKASTMVDREFSKPIKAGYDKAVLDTELKNLVKANPEQGGGVGKNDAAAKDVTEFYKLLHGNQKQSEATLKVLEKIANEKSTTKDEVLKGAMSNKGAGMADLVKEIKKELGESATPAKPASERGSGKTALEGKTSTSPLETLGKGVEALGGLFTTTPGRVLVTGVDANAGGGIVDKPSLRIVGEAGPEAIFNQGQLESYTAKIMGSAAGAMPKLEMPKLDLSGMSKSINTSISSVTGGGSTTTKQVQNDSSKAAEKELASVKEQMQAEKNALREKLKAQIGDGSKLGGNAVAKELRVGDEGKGIAEKYKAMMEPLQKQIDAGISFETTKKAAAIEETTKIVSEQIAITKSGNSKLTDLWDNGSKDKLSTAKKDSESLASMYKDDSKSKLDLAKKTNADAFKEAELAKSVIGTSVKGMSDDMIESMIPKGAKIEDYYIDMNDKIQSNSADFVANMEKNAKASTSVIETYSTTISSSSKKMAGDIAGALPGATTKTAAAPATAPMPMSMASMSVGMDRAMLKTDDQKKVFDEIMTLNAKASKEKQLSLQEEMMAAHAANKAATEAIDLMEEKLDAEGKGFKDLTGKQKEEYEALRKQQNESFDASDKAREAIKAVDRAERAKQNLQQMGYDIAVKQEEDKTKIVETAGEKIKSDISDALPVKEIESRASSVSDEQKKIIEKYKDSSSESITSFANAASRGMKERSELIAEHENYIGEIRKKAADQGRALTESEEKKIGRQEESIALNKKGLDEAKTRYETLSNFEKIKAQVSEESAKKISNDIKEALPVKDVAAKQEEFQSQFTESQQKIIDDYKGYSEENRSFHAQAMESGIKNDTDTAQKIGDRISKMKAAIGDRQATDEEQKALENETLNKAMFEKQVEKKKEMLDVMQNLGEYSAKREQELKEKAAKDAIAITAAIEDKKTDAIKSDIAEALPVANEDRQEGKLIDRQEGKLIDTPKSKAMSISDMMAGGMTMGANGMPIMRSIDSAKQTLNQKTPSPGKKINQETGEEYTPVDTTKPKTAAAEKKPDAKAATKESTLSDVVAQLNSLNKQMGQLIAVSEDGHKATTKAAKSGASNIYAR